MDFEGRSIVADVKDDRFFFQVEFSKCGHDFSNAIVHGGDHRECLSTPLRHFAGESLQVLRGGIKRDVGRSVGTIEEERLVLVASNESARGFAVGIQMVEVGCFWTGWTVFPIESEVGPTWPVGVLVVHVIEAMFQNFLWASKVPLARHASGISCNLETLGNGALGIESVQRFTVAFHTKSILIAARQQTGPRRNALWSGDVACSHSDTPPSQPIEVGRLQIAGDALAREIRVTVIITEDHNDVGLVDIFGVSLSRVRKKCQKPKQEKYGSALRSWEGRRQVVGSLFRQGSLFFRGDHELDRLRGFFGDQELVRLRQNLNREAILWRAGRFD